MSFVWKTHAIMACITSSALPTGAFVMQGVLCFVLYYIILHDHHHHMVLHDHHITWSSSSLCVLHHLYYMIIIRCTVFLVLVNYVCTYACTHIYVPLQIIHMLVYLSAQWCKNFIKLTSWQLYFGPIFWAFKRMSPWELTQIEYLFNNMHNKNFWNWVLYFLLHTCLLSATLTQITPLKIIFMTLKALWNCAISQLCHPHASG